MNKPCESSKKDLVYDTPEESGIPLTYEVSLSLLTHPTPFTLDEGCHVICENTNYNCTHRQIDEMIGKKLINPIDIELLKILATYRFINTWNITYALNHLHELNPSYRKDSYHANIKKLVRAGLLLRYTIISDKKEDFNLSKQRASALRFYCLSTGAYSYISPITHAPHGQSAATDDLKKLEQLVLSQFVIHFLSHYRQHNVSASMHLHKRLGSTPFEIDGYLRFHPSTPDTAVDHEIDIYLLASRRHKKAGQTALLTKLRLLVLWLSKQTPSPILMILLLVEDLRMALETFIAIQHVPLLQNQAFYFSVDSTVPVYAPLSCLYLCHYSQTNNQAEAVRKDFPF